MYVFVPRLGATESPGSGNAASKKNNKLPMWLIVVAVIVGIVVVLAFVFMIIAIVYKVAFAGKS